MKELEGILGYDPELRFTPGGKPLCSFELVMPDRKVNCFAWEQLGEDIANCDLYKKDTPVVIAGFFKTREFQGKSFKEFTVKAMAVLQEPTA